MPALQMGSFIVVNNSGNDVHAFVSNWTNSDGDESWFRLAAGSRDSWDRNGWECVGFKSVGDTHRAGKYIPVDRTVTFHGFDKKIDVE